MKKKATSAVPTRPQSHTLSPVPAKSEAAVDRVIVSMNRKLRHLESKYQDLVSQCQGFRKSEQSESVTELREREALQELEAERDKVDAEIQLLLKSRKAKTGEKEESKDTKNAKNIHEAISETLKNAQNAFLRLIHLAAVSEYQAKTQATDLFVELSDALWTQIFKLQTNVDNRSIKALASEIQHFEQSRQVLDLKIAEANETLRQRYSAQLLRARQRIASLRSDNLQWESQLKAFSRQTSSACSSPVGTSTAFTMAELGSPVSRDSVLRLTTPTGQLAKSRELRLSFRPAQSERISMSPYGNTRGTRLNEENEDRRIEEIKREVELLKTQLSASARERKKQLFPESPSDSTDYKKKLAVLTAEAKDFIKLSRDIIRSVHNPEAEEALKSLTRMVNDILRDWSFSEWRRSFHKPQEWSSKYALEQANKMLEGENKKLEEALAVEKARSDRLIEMVEAFKKDIQPKSAELVTKLTKETRQLTERKLELETLVEALQKDRELAKKEHETVISELTSDCEGLTEELKLLRKSKAELLRSSQIRDTEIKAKVTDLEREKAKTRTEIAQYVQTAASRLASQYEFLEEKLSEVRNRLMQVEDLAKQRLSDTLQRLHAISSLSNTPEEVKSMLFAERERMENALKQNKEWANGRLLEMASRAEAAEGKESALLRDLRRERETNEKLQLELETAKNTHVKTEEMRIVSEKYEELRKNAENAQEKIHLLTIETAQLRYENGIFEDRIAEFSTKEVAMSDKIMQLREQLALTAKSEEKEEDIIEEISSKADRRYEVDLAAEIVPEDYSESIKITELREKCDNLARELAEKEGIFASANAIHAAEMIENRAQFEESLRTLQSQRSDLIDEIQRVKDSASEAALRAISTWEDSAARSKESLEAAIKRNEGVEKELVRLQEANRRLIEGKALSEAENTHRSQLLCDFERIKSELKDTKEENQRLRAASSDHHLSSMEDYETRISNFKDQLKAVTAACDLLEREKTQIQAEASRERDLLNSKMRILAVSIEELTQAKSQALETANQREIQRNALEKQCEEGKNQYEILSNRVVALGKEAGEAGDMLELALMALDSVVKRYKAQGDLCDDSEKSHSEAPISALIRGEKKEDWRNKQAYEELTGKYQALLTDWKEALNQCETLKAALEFERKTLKAEADQAKSAFSRLEDDYFNLKLQHNQQIIQLQADLSRQSPSQPRPSPLKTPPQDPQYLQDQHSFHLNPGSDIESEGSQEESLQDQAMDMTPGPGDVVKTIEYDGIAWNLICSGNRQYEWLRLDEGETPSERDMSMMEKLRGIIGPVCAEGVSVQEGVSALVREITEIRRKKSMGSPIFPKNRGSIATQFALLERGASSPDLSDRREELNSFEMGEGQLGLPAPVSFGLSSREPGSGRSEPHFRDEQISKYLHMINDLRDELKTLKIALSSEQSDNKRLEEMLHVLRDELRATSAKGKSQGESLLPHIRTAVISLAVELPKLSGKGEGLLSTIYSHFDLSAKQVALIEQGRKRKKGEEKAAVVSQVLI